MSNANMDLRFQGKDLGTVNNAWLAKNFVMGYLNPTTPASEVVSTSHTCTHVLSRLTHPSIHPYRRDKTLPKDSIHF